VNRERFFALSIAVLAAAFSRLVPHPPNFTPIAAMALFGGAFFSDRRLAFMVPLMAMIASDFVIGFHPLAPVVYATFLLVVCIGFWIKRHFSPSAIFAGTLAGSFLFFVTTNFAVWLSGTLYPKTAAGLLTCFVAAIPFFRNTLAGDLVYTVLLFGLFVWSEKRFPALRAPQRDTGTFSEV